MSNHAFYGCGNLTNIYGVFYSINDEALCGCNSLEEIYIDTSEEALIFYAAVADTPKLKIYCKDKSKISYIMAGHEELTNEARAKVTEDKIAPKVSVSYSKTSLTNGSVIVTIKSTDGELLRPMEGWTSGNEYKTLTKKYTSNVDTKVKISDFVGNETEVNIKITNIDTTAPKITISGTTGTTWRNTPATVKVKAEDKSGIKSLEIQKVGSDKKYVIKGSSGTVKLNEYGQYKVVAVDKAGNKKTSATFWNYVDTDKPKITISGTTGTTWRNTPATVNVKAEDKSGIQSLKVQKVGSIEEYTIKGSSGDVKLNKYGEYKVIAVDKAGNEKISETFFNYVDTDKPKIESVSSDDTGKITAKVKDTTSGISSVKLIGDGKTYTTKMPTTEDIVTFNVKNSGTYTLKATDNAGNIKTEEIEVTIKTIELPEDPVEKEEEEEKKENPEEPEIPEDVTIDEDSVKDETGDEGKDPDAPKNPEDVTIDEDSVKNETSDGEEEKDTSKDEITQIEEKPDGGEKVEVPVEINSGCQVEYYDANRTVTIIKYLGTEDALVLPQTLEKDGIQYTITKIEKDAFKSTGIRRIKIPETVKEICDDAFANCTYLEEVIIQNDNIILGNNSFTNNDGKIKIYSRQESTAETFAKNNNIGAGIYIKEGDFEYIIKEKVFEDFEITEEADEGVTVTDKKEVIAEVIAYNGNKENVVIPNTVGEYKVSSVREKVFKGNTTIKQIELLDNMRNLDSEAFAECSNLSKVILRNSKISIATDSFKNSNQEVVFYGYYDSTGIDYAKANNKQYLLIYGAFIYQLNEDTKTADVLAATIGEGDPEYVTIENTVGDYTLGKIKVGALLNTKLKGVIIKDKNVPLENVDIEDGALEGSENVTVYCYQGSTVDNYLKTANLGIKIAYLGENDEIKPEGIDVVEKEINIKVGEEDSIFTQIYPSITTSKEVVYKSNNEKVVTVDEEGNIKGVGEGETTIDVMHKEDNSKVATVTVKVEYIKVTLNLNGGKIEIGGKTYENTVELKATYGQKVNDIEKPTREGYDFTGWYEEVTDEEGIRENVYLEDNESETITEDITLFAGWIDERKTEEGKPIQNGDGTTSDKILPNTGSVGISLIGLVTLSSIITGIRYKKFNIK